jgi:magnesium transporter
MIEFFKTEGGKIVPVSDWEPGCWINMVNPTDEEVEHISVTRRIDQEFLRAALDEEETSHIDAEDDQTLIILDVPLSERVGSAMNYSTLPVGIILTKDDIVTVSLKPNSTIGEFASGICKNVRTDLKTQFILHIFIKIAKRYLQYLKQIDKLSAFVEKQLHKSMKNKELFQLLELEKSLVYFSTSLKSNETTLEKIFRGRYIKLYDEDQDLMEDVLIEVKQAIEMSNIYSSILSGTMDAFASVISNNLNIVMKVLTSVTILMTIPTIVFSYYGQNVTGLPIPTAWFPLVVTAIAAAGTFMVLKFKDLI